MGEILQTAFLISAGAITLVLLVVTISALFHGANWAYNQGTLPQLDTRIPRFAANAYLLYARLLALAYGATWVVLLALIVGGIFYIVGQIVMKVV